VKRALGGISKRTRFRILARDHYRCVYCGRSPEAGVTLHVDHRMPVSAGGASTDDNLCTACADCNLGKGAAVLRPAIDVHAYLDTYDDEGQAACCDPDFWPDPVV
jgi:5-methylcytosine-specific restriction endonuclease McrA